MLTVPGGLRQASYEDIETMDTLYGLWQILYARQRRLVRYGMELIHEPIQVVLPGGETP